ncbi:MAG: toll/interleukin-1 receptor domain-containing protein [Pseudomonadota bacterium]
MADRTHIFISHRREDAQGYSPLLVTHLEKILPSANIFFDLSVMEGGDDWSEEIDVALDACDVLLAVIGPEWMIRDEYKPRIFDHRDVVQREIRRALSRGVDVYPILLQDAAMPPIAALPECLHGLRKKHALKLRQSDFRDDLDRIAGHLQKSLPAEAKAPAPFRHLRDGAAGNMIDVADAASLIERAAGNTRAMRDVMLAAQERELYALAAALGERIEFRDKPPAGATMKVATRGKEPKRTKTAQQTKLSLIADLARARGLLNSGPPRHALEAYEELLPDVVAAYGEESATTLTARHNHAYALLNVGQAEAAEAAFRDLLPLREKVQGAEHPGTLATRHEHTRALLNLGQAEAAEAAFRDLLPLREKVQGAEHPGTLATRHEHARALLNLGQAEAAEAAFRDLLPLSEKVQGAEHLGTLVTRHNHASALLDLGQTEASEAVLRDLLPIREKVEGAEHPSTLATRRALVRAALKAGDVAAARAAMAPLPEEGGDPDPRRKGQTALLRAWFADLDGDAAAAEAWLERAEEFLADRAPEHYARRTLARYRETRVPGGAGGTTLPEGVRRV